MKVVALSECAQGAEFHYSRVYCELAFQTLKRLDCLKLGTVELRLPQQLRRFHSKHRRNAL